MRISRGGAGGGDSKPVGGGGQQACDRGPERLAILLFPVPGFNV